MLCFIAPEPPFDLQLHPAPQLLEPAGDPSGNRERLRHLIIGSPAGVRSAIARLHQLRYSEHHGK